MLLKHHRARKEPFSFSTSLILLFFAFFFVSQNIDLHAFETPEEGALYNNGIKHRDDKKFAQAKECFLPLAEKGIVKAEHNLAMCFYSMSVGNIDAETSAYVYFKRAAKRGFEPSQRNVRKLNLFDILLSEDCFISTALFLGLQDLSHLGRRSRRAYGIFKRLLAETNFLTSPHGYAVNFRSRVGNIRFEPQPQEVRLLPLAKVENGSVVRFFDPENLRATVDRERPFLFQAGDNVYFVCDPSVAHGEERVPQGGQIQRSYFINVVADKPVKISGQVTLPLGMSLPHQSDFTGLVAKGKALSSIHKEGHTLAALLETFDEELYRRTGEASTLLEEYERAERQLDLTSFRLTATPPARILKRALITAGHPIVCVAKSITDLNLLLAKFSLFSPRPICYVNPRSANPGVYCRGPLSLVNQVEFFSEGYLTITGNVNLPNHDLVIKGRNGVNLGASINAKSFVLGGGV